MLGSICNDLKFVLLADAYYANGKVIGGLETRSGDQGEEVHRGLRASAYPHEAEARSS